MREYLFRGKRLNNGEWVEGYYMELGGKYHYILTGQIDITNGYPDLVKNPVDHKTVGQYTGLKDKNGRKIFEGDILRVSWSAPRRETVYENYEVVYSRSGFFARRKGKLFGQVSNYISQNVNMRCEIIGNIHDNPELLEKEEV